MWFQVASPLVGASPLPCWELPVLEVPSPQSAVRRCSVKPKLLFWDTLFATSVSCTLLIVAPGGTAPAMSKASTARRTATSPLLFCASLTLPANMLGPSALLVSWKDTWLIGS